MKEVVGIKFKKPGKIYFFDPAGLKLNLQDMVIADTANGEEFAKIAMANKLMPDEKIIEPLRKVIRLANKKDIKQNEENKAKEREAFNIAIEKIKRDTADFIRINNELSKQEAYSRQYEKQIDGITQFLKSYVKDYSDEDSVGEMLRRLDKKLDEYYRAKSEYENAVSAKNDFETGTDISLFAADEDEDDNISLEDIAADMSQTDIIIENYSEQIAQCNRQLENLQIQAEECENFRQELNELESVQENEIKKERLLKLTKQIMEDSKQSFTAKYMEPVMAGFRKYFKILAGYEPDTFSMDADTKLTVMEQNMPRDIGYLSAGKQDLVGICMRMALVEAMYKDEKPFLLFDDPFVNMDDNNIKGAMKLLDEIAKDYQVIYFTCSESRIHN